MHPTRIARWLRIRRREGQREREHEQQRERLLALLPTGGTCAEIGSWKGDFADTILSRLRPELLYLVDPWEYMSDGPGDAEAGQREMDGVHDGVAARFRAEIERGQVRIRRARSLDAAASFAEESLDWVYIDGDHAYEAVKRDLDAYYRTVKAGGFIAGDDYGVRGGSQCLSGGGLAVVGGWSGDGITRAVDEFADRCADLTIIGTQFLLRKH